MHDQNHPAATIDLPAPQADKPAATVDPTRLSRKEIRQLLSEIYKTCCENDLVEMTDLAALLEYLCEQLEHGDKYDCWSLLKLDRQRYDKAPIVAELGKLKQTHLERLTQKIINQVQELAATDAEKAFALWRREYLAALASWQNMVYLPLCEAEFPFPDTYRREVEAFRLFNELIVDHRWVEAYDQYCRLANDETVPTRERSAFASAAGEICLYWMPDMEPARSHFEQADALYQSSDTLRVLGQYFSKKQELEKARSYFLNAISADPLRLANYLQMGSSYQDENKNDVAEQWFNDAWNTNFTSVPTYSKLISVNLHTRGRDALPQVQELLAKAAVLEPNTRYNYELYVLYRDTAFYFSELKLYEDAKAFYKQAIALKPTLTAARLDMAYICAYNHEPNEAEQLFNEVLHLREDDFDGLWGLGWLYDQQGQPEKAEAAYTACLARRPAWAGTINTALGDLFFNSSGAPQRLEKALRYYVAALEAAPHNTFYHDNVLKVLEESGDDAALEKSLLQAQQQWPRSAAYRSRLGKLYLRQQRYPEAIAAFQLATDMEPANPAHYEQLGLACQGMGNNAEAEAHFLHCVRLSDDHLYNNRLGIFYYQQNELQKAEEFYRKAIALQPTDAVLLENLSLCLEKQNRYNEAEKTYLEAARLQPTTGRYWHLAGLICYHQQRFPEAIRHFQQASEKEPANKNYATDLANTYLAAQQWPDALALLQRLSAAEPEDRQLTWSLALAHYYTGQYREALACLSTIEHKMKDDLSWYQFAGLCYEMMQDMAAAQTVYESALRLAPANDYFHNRLGLRYLSATDSALRSKAKEHFARAASLAPTLLVYRHNLARALFDEGDFAEAERLYKEVMAAEPGNHLLKNDYGVLLHNTGRYEEAIAEYKGAIALFATDPLYFSNLAAAYEQLNQPEKALEAYSKAEALRLSISQQQVPVK